MRRGREEFDADALAFVGRFTEKDDTRFLLFLREGIGEDEHGIHGERLVQVHQAAVRVDHDGFAGLAKAPIVGILSRNNHTHPHEDPGTSANLVEIVLGHDETMLRHFDCAVNESVIRVFPPCNVGWVSRRACDWPACFYVPGNRLRAIISRDTQRNRHLRGDGK